MERILSYTLTDVGVTPAQPLFAGVQGDHRATALVITPDRDVAAFFEEKRAQNKELSFKIDVINQAGQTVSMKDTPIEQLSDPFYLTRQMTSSGLDCLAVLSITAKGQEGENQIYKAQMRLYFEQVRGGTPIPEQTLPADDLEAKYLECEQKLEDKTENALSSIDQRSEIVRQTALDIAERHSQAADLVNQAKVYADDAKESAEVAEQESSSSSELLAEVRRIAHSAADLTSRSEAAAARTQQDAIDTAETLATVETLAGQTAENAENARSAAQHAEESANLFATKQDLFAQVIEEPNQRLVKSEKNLSFEVGDSDVKGSVDIGGGYVSAYCFGDMEFSSKIGGIVLRGKAEETDTANIDACGCRIRNLASPKNDADAVNKEYLDLVLGDIDSALNKLLVLEESYIGGGSV